METQELVKGYSTSRIIKGGWQLAGGHGFINKSSAIEDMFRFVEVGIITFDCADIYTGVEEMIGEFFSKYKRRYGKKKTSKIHIHTKFVPDLDLLSKITKQDVEKIIDRSLKRLKVDRLDLVQYHWWDYDIKMYLQVAYYLVDMQTKGKIRHIGVTNFDVPRLTELVESGIPIVSNQVQHSVLDNRPENGMVAFCQQHNIKLLCYGTAAGGFLSEKYLGAKEPEGVIENISLTKYKLIIDEFGGWELFQELLGVLKQIAERYRVSIANVGTRFVLDKPQVAAVIIGARNMNHLQDNLNTFNFSLDIKDMELLSKIFKKAKGPLGDTYDLERIKGGRHASIMKYNLNKV